MSTVFLNGGLLFDLIFIIYGGSYEESALFASIEFNKSGNYAGRSASLFFKWTRLSTSLMMFFRSWRACLLSSWVGSAV